MRFNPGDKVVAIRPATKEERWQSPLWTKDMDFYDGKELTVREYESGKYVSVFESIYVFKDTWLRLASEVNISPQQRVISKIKQMENKRKELGYAF
jgi:hypothetical protein